MLLPKAKFEQHKKLFYSKVTQSPYSVLISQNAVAPGASALEAFVGDSPRTVVKTVSLKCLYEKTVNPRQREKYGLPDTVDGVIFLAPKQLIDAFGTFRIAKNMFTIQFEGREQVINNITYMEAVHDSCIAVRLDIKDKLKGG